MSSEIEAAGVKSQPANPVRQRSRWAKPLRVHLSVIIVMLLIAISIPLMWLTFREGRQSAITAAEQQMLLLSRNTIELYDSVFQDGHSIVTMGSVLPSLLAEPPAFMDAKREFLMRALKGTSHVDGVYVGYGSGAFFHMLRVEDNARWRASVSAPEGTAFAERTLMPEIDHHVSAWRFLDRDGNALGESAPSRTTFDPRRRPWYKAAVAADGPVTIGPYVSASTQALTLTVAAPMAGDRDAVMGADVTLETISNMLIEHPVSEHSSGYVFDGDGRLIVHSDPEVMSEIVQSFDAQSKAETSLAADDPVLDAVRPLLAGKGAEDGTIRFSIGSEPYLARISSIGSAADSEDLLSGHRIVIAAPLADFTAASIALLKKTLLIAAILVTAGILTALVVSRRISRALVALTADANRIGDLDFEGRAPAHSWIAEINSLARALSAARDAIKTFAVYVPKELVRQIVASGQAEAGRAVRREVTVLFTDIRDFTTISEQHSPEEVVDMLSAYFQAMNEVVQRHNGIIVQYLGDSIYAMWNAPTENPNHVIDGCRCTLALKAEIDAFNAANARAGKPEFVTRFGLHTGIAVVGSVGAEERRQYTAMGDTVNVASRLEGMNKQYGTSILASAAIRERAKAENLAGIVFRPLGTASAKGRHAQIEIYELIDGPGTLGPTS